MTRRVKRAAWLSLTLVLTALAPLAGQQLTYPEIHGLSAAKDPLFKQQQELVDLAYQAIAAGESPGDLALFQYRAGPDDTLFSLASRFNIPYETLATLNGLRMAGSVAPGQLLLVPTQPGLFLALDHPTELDRLMEAWRSAAPGTSEIRLTVARSGRPEAMAFFPGERFHPLERAFFLGILFRFPLPAARLTSSFGIRSNPFTGHPTFHAGIDLAAPVGTEVFAARDGTVAATGFDAVLGNFVRLDHGDGYETVYGHLSAVLISLHQEVRSGTILGRVGSTGMSTGPHLHFEIRRQGHPLDPVPLLPGKK
jgi:murein DD-endopeptidase MepM/ murein hydrolase activator NlpD